MGVERIIGIGIDICNVLQIQQHMEEVDTFIIDNFTDPEIVYCEQAGTSLSRAQRYARRFAAKEAVTKALGINGMEVNFEDISVLKELSGQPFIFLQGRTKAIAQGLGVTGIFISMARAGDIAQAYCMTVSENRS